MGSNQTKEKVVINENIANVAEVHTKLDIIGITMMIIIVLMVLVLCVFIIRKCKNGIKDWLKKQMIVSSTTLQGIKVETVQPQPQNKVVF